MKDKTLISIIFSILIGVGLGLGAKTYIDDFKNINIVRSNPLREVHHNYEFINPLLACELSEKLDFKEIRDLSQALGRLEASTKKEGKLERASIYARDLTNSRWAQVNEDMEFSPASLMKVPFMIAFLKYAESYPDILERKVVFNQTEDENLKQHEKPAKPLLKGRTYTVTELIYNLIVYSDNNAIEPLFDSVDGKYVEEVFKDLGITLPPKEVQAVEDYMTSKAFSLFFRVLYNSSYLARGLSNSSLELLSKVDYKKGIVSGIPADVKVAHKFGEKNVKNSDSVELHDCGIVYLPGHPYLICVMTKGENWEDLQNFIGSVSRITYDYFREDSD